MATARAIHEDYKPHVELGSENGIGDDTAELAILVEAEYPSSDGVPMADNPFKSKVAYNVMDVLEEWALGRPDVYLGVNMAVFPQEGNRRIYRSPTFFVALNAKPDSPDPDYARRVWRIWKEGKAPDFILEVAAPTTWKEDYGVKRYDYESWGVREYWRFNPMPHDEIPHVPLIGERLVDGRYERIPIETDEAGMLRGRSEVLDLVLYAHGYRFWELRLWDPVGEK